MSLRAGAAQRRLLQSACCKIIGAIWDTHPAAPNQISLMQSSVSAGQCLCQASSHLWVHCRHLTQTCSTLGLSQPPESNTGDSEDWNLLSCTGCRSFPKGPPSAPGTRGQQAHSNPSSLAGPATSPAPGELGSQSCTYRRSSCSCPCHLPAGARLTSPAGISLPDSSQEQTQRGPEQRKHILLQLPGWDSGTAAGPTQKRLMDGARQPSPRGLLLALRAASGHSVKPAVAVPVLCGLPAAHPTPQRHQGNPAAGGKGAQLQQPAAAPLRPACPGLGGARIGTSWETQRVEKRGRSQQTDTFSTACCRAIATLPSLYNPEETGTQPSPSCLLQRQN